MRLETLRYEVRDHVAWITLDRPAALNAVNLQAVKELCEVANRCSSDRAVRAAVLTGSGDRAFCAGGDVADFAAAGDGLELLIKEMTTYLHVAVSRFARMDAPLVGAINGVAAGAGFSLALACDLAIAADHARFSSAYSKIGFTPDGSSTYFLSRLLGRRRALELYLTERVLSAQEALDWGLLNRVVAGKDLQAEAGKLAARLAEGPTRAYGGVKKLMHAASVDSLESQMELETHGIVRSGTSVDGREGARAFVEKRAPRFRGE